MVYGVVCRLSDRGKPNDYSSYNDNINSNHVVLVYARR